MTRGKHLGAFFLWLAIMVGIYWFQLPAINLMSIGFWFYLFVGVGLLGAYLLIVALMALERSVTRVSFGSRVRYEKPLASTPYGRPLNAIALVMMTLVAVLGTLLLVNSRLFRAKSYATVITVAEKDFTSDFPETNLSTLALLDRSSAKKIGDTYLGTIDKVSQFGISDDYRQISIGEQPYRVSPLEYKSFWKWVSNRKDGIAYYVKVNQTTGKAELVKLDKPMQYSDSEYGFSDTLRHLRLKYPTTIFADPSFEVDDAGNPFYVATTYAPRFGLSSQDPTGVILLDAVTGETTAYTLSEVPEWVDRVYSASNVLSRVNDYYTYQDGFWNTLFSQTGVKQTTESYNYITIGSDVYLYTGITSATADSSNLGFILVNMRTREVTNYKLASATEVAAQGSAEGEVQEKGYRATAPTLVKLDDKAYYLVSLKDDAGLVKSYAIVDAEDYQQVTVNNDIETLMAQFTDRDITGLTGMSESSQKGKQVSGTVDALASQVISGTTVYYISSGGEIYKVKASSDSPDLLPFLAVGDQFRAEVTANNVLKTIVITKGQ